MFEPSETNFTLQRFLVGVYELVCLQAVRVCESLPTVGTLSIDVESLEIRKK